MISILAFMKKHRGILFYMVFGVLTTVVNYAVYLPLYNLAGLSAALSNVIAWAVTVIYAYLTNKPFVFGSHDWRLSTVIPEFGRFAACRIGSGALETVAILVLVDGLSMGGNVVKVGVTVVVVIINYLGSRLLVFRRKE